MTTRNISFILNNIHADDRDTIFNVKFLKAEYDDHADVTIRPSDLSVREKFVEYAEDDRSTAAVEQRKRVDTLAFLARRVKQLNNARAKISTLNRADILITDKKEREDE